MDVFRKNYTPITDEQKALVLAIKEKAEELFSLYEKGSEYLNRDTNNQWVVANCSNQAVARLEESVMWAVKAATTEIAAVPV